MGEITQRIKKVLPIEMWISLLLVIVFNTLAYYGVRLITAGRYHYDMTSWIDEQIPFVPWTLGIYWSGYLFWSVNYVIGCRQDTERAYRFICADLFAKVLCLLCFRQQTQDHLWLVIPYGMKECGCYIELMQLITCSRLSTV